MKKNAIGVLFSADNSIKASHITLNEMQKCVGGYIELIYLNDGMVLVVNEEGLTLNLPYNERATNTALAEGKKHHIVGDVLLIGANFIK
jgi:hypothetical protein